MRCWAFLVAASVAWVPFVNCSRSGDTTNGGSGPGGGDAGVECPSGPTSMLQLTIAAPPGPVPVDTSVAVTWSAGEEPVFVLDDPTTWHTLADGNILCEVDPKQPPPTALASLVCHLWTSGATHVRVAAKGYVAYDATLKPKYSTECKGPVPTNVAVNLSPEPDAGAGGGA